MLLYDAVQPIRFFLSELSIAGDVVSFCDQVTFRSGKSRQAGSDRGACPNLRLPARLTENAASLILGTPQVDAEYAGQKEVIS